MWAYISEKTGITTNKQQTTGVSYPNDYIGGVIVHESSNVLRKNTKLIYTW